MQTFMAGMKDSIFSVALVSRFSSDTITYIHRGTTFFRVKLFDQFLVALPVTHGRELAMKCLPRSQKKAI